MKTRKIILAVCLLLFLIGCGPAATVTPVPATATLIPPTVTQIPPTSTEQPAPTSTQVPSTNTPMPATATPSPSSSKGDLIAFVSTRDGNGEIYVMNADGSNPRRLTNHGLWDGFPDWSPDGSQIAYYSYNNDRDWVIKVMNLDGSDPRQLTDSGACDGAPHWSPTGTQITYDSGDCTGDYREIYVIDVGGGIPRNLSNNPADDMLAAWSPDGAYLVFSSNRDGNYDLYVMDADGGNVRRLTDNPAEDHAPAWSPDGTQIAFYSNRDGNEEIYVMDADGGNPRNLTNHAAADWFPRWSPDGRRITFSSKRDGNLEIYVMSADGSDVHRLTNSRGDDFNSVWQPSPAGESAHAWLRSYKDVALGTALAGMPTDDGGYILVGSTHYTHYNQDNEDLYLLKIDAAGEPLWEKTLGGERFDRGIGILPAVDGGWMILGETRSFGAGDRDLYLLKINSQGEQLWSQTFGGPQDEMGFSIRPTADGGYILTGQTGSFGAGGTDVYLIKTDAQGKEVWFRTFGSALNEEGSTAIELPDGGFLIQGVLLYEGRDYLAMNPDLYLIQTDAQGNARWSRVLEEPGGQAGFKMVPTSDGHYLVIGLRSDTGSEAGTDPLVVKIDVDGNILWKQAIGEANMFDYSTAVLSTADGGYLLTGALVRGGNGSIPLIKLDKDGQVLWRQTLSEEPGNRAGVEILAAPDGGYLVIGNVSDGGRGWYTLLIKTDGE